jgi:hypothetical protein
MMVYVGSFQGEKVALLAHTNLCFDGRERIPPKTKSNKVTSSSVQSRTLRRRQEQLSDHFALYFSSLQEIFACLFFSFYASYIINYV